MHIFTYLIFLVIALLGITFACLNAEPIVINYYIGSSQLPLSLLLVITLSIGVMMGLMTAALMLLKLKRNNFRLQQRIKLAEKEITNLRAIPLKDSH